MKQAADHALQGRRDARAACGCAGRASPPRLGAPAPGAAARAKSSRGPRRGPGADRRAKALEQKAALEAQMRANREAKEAADRKRREEDAAEDASGPRRRPRTAAAARRAGAPEAGQQQRLDDLYAQQEATRRRRNRRHEERTTPAVPAPRSPRQPPSAQLRSPGRRRSALQSAADAAGVAPIPSLAAQKVPPRSRRLGGAGHKISDDDLEQTTSDFEPRRGGARALQDDRRRRVARAALPQNAGGALEALAEKIQQAPDLRTLAGLPPAAPLSRRRVAAVPHISAEDDEADVARGRVDVRAAARRRAAEAAYNLDTPPPRPARFARRSATAAATAGARRARRGLPARRGAKHRRVLAGGGASRHRPADAVASPAAKRHRRRPGGPIPIFVSSPRWGSKFAAVRHKPRRVRVDVYRMWRAPCGGRNRWHFPRPTSSSVAVAPADRRASSPRSPSRLLLGRRGRGGTWPANPSAAPLDQRPADPPRRSVGPPRRAREPRNFHVTLENAEGAARPRTDGGIA